MMLMTNTWNSKINSRAFRFINNRKHMEDLPLPVAQDLLKLRLYLDKKLARDFEALETNPNKDNWKALTESTLVRIVLFNKRRGGEAQRMKESHFSNRPDWVSVHNEDILKSLSKTERVLCKKMELVKIPGKRKPVPVIL